MASGPTAAVFASDDDDEPSSSENDLDVLNANDEDEELDEEEDDDDEEEDINSRPLRIDPVSAAAAPASTFSDPMSVLLAIPAVSAVTVASVPREDSGPDPKRQRAEEAVVERKPPQLDESRRLFQRLWTDEDEIELLQGFLEYSAQRGSSNSHHHETALFYDQIRSKLQLEFNKNQLVEKMRRLKKKFRNVMSKIDSGKEFYFKTAHDQATFEISRKIWNTSLVKGNGGVLDDNVLDDDEGNVNSVNLNDDGGEKKTPNSKKRVRPKPGFKVEHKKLLDDVVLLNCTTTANNGNVERGAPGSAGNGGGLKEGNVAGLIEETVRNCLSPLFKEFMNSASGRGNWGARGFGGLLMNTMPLNFDGIDSGSAGEIVNEKWRKQQILELEVYSKRLELVQDQIQVTLKELRSGGG